MQCSFSDCASVEHRLPLYYELKIVFVLWLVLPITEVSIILAQSRHVFIVVARDSGSSELSL